MLAVAAVSAGLERGRGGSNSGTGHHGRRAEPIVLGPLVGPPLPQRSLSGAFPEPPCVSCAAALYVAVDAAAPAVWSMHGEASPLYLLHTFDIRYTHKLHTLRLLLQAPLRERGHEHHSGNPTTHHGFNMLNLSTCVQRTLQLHLHSRHASRLLLQAPLGASSRWYDGGRGKWSLLALVT